jgi:hypothetical protein
MSTPATVYLNSALDSIPRRPIISAAGQYQLSYEVFAENFPLLSFQLDLSVSEDPATTSASVARRPN